MLVSEKMRYKSIRKFAAQKHKVFSETPLNQTPLGPHKMLRLEGIPVSRVYVNKNK